MTLEWQHYATWLMNVEGIDVYDALTKVSKVYAKQYKKEFETEKAQEIIQFIKYTEEGDPQCQ